MPQSTLYWIIGIIIVVLVILIIATAVRSSRRREEAVVDADARRAERAEVREETPVLSLIHI